MLHRPQEAATWAVALTMSGCFAMGCAISLLLNEGLGDATWCVQGVLAVKNCRSEALALIFLSSVIKITTR